VEVTKRLGNEALKVSSKGIKASRLANGMERQRLVGEFALFKSSGYPMFSIVPFVSINTGVHGSVGVGLLWLWMVFPLA
jgi:hypothetical protein